MTEIADLQSSLRRASGTPAAPARRMSPRVRAASRAGAALAASAAMVAAAVAAGLALFRAFDTSLPAALVLVLAVLASAVRFGLGPSLAASMAAAAALDFFFIDPVFSFAIARTRDLATLVVFCVVAATASRLAASAREQAAAAEQRTMSVAALYRLSRVLAAALSPEEAAAAVADEGARSFGAEVALRAGPDAPPDNPAADELSAPADGGAVRARRPGRPFTQAERELAAAMAGLLDLALARLRLGERMEEARLAAARQALTETLLDAIAHDLRAPLAGIAAAAGSLRRAVGPAAAEARRDLGVIEAEAERLNRLVANLVSMIRLKVEAPGPRTQTADLVDALDSAASRCAHLLRGHDLRLRIAPDLPFARLDPAMFEQVMLNLLDNAAKFSPEGSVVEVVARRAADDRVAVEVRDQGPGIAPEDLDRVFEKFVSLRRPGVRAAGLGLGLPICRGLLNATGAAISAANRGDGAGLVVTVLLPAEPATLGRPAAEQAA